MVVHHFEVNVDVQLWSQYVSFVMVGMIIVASIRGLLIQLMKVRFGGSTQKFTEYFIG